MTVHSMGQWVKRQILPIISLLILTIPAMIFYTTYMKDGTRSWYYYTSNDACQAFSAHGVSQRLGAALENAVWPGATINMPYLYAAMLKERPNVYGKSDAVRDLLASSVFFHWRSALLAGIAFIWIFYFFVLRLTENNWLALAASLVLTTNEFYAMQVTSVRPELISLLFVFMAALLIIADRKSRPIVGPVLFGLFVALAVFSKIQVLPVIPFVVGGYFVLRRDIDRQAGSKIYGTGMALFLVCLAFLASLGFIKSNLIVQPRYGLTSMLPNAGYAAFILCNVCVLLFLLGFTSSRMQIHKTAAKALHMIGGAILALFLVALPNLYFGGIKTFITTINTLLFGIASYARYGIKLPSASGWGQATTFADKLQSFATFQTSSSIPVIGDYNLAMVCAIVVVVRLIITKMSRFQRMLAGESELGRKAILFNSLAVLFLSMAVLFDFVLTNRTVGGAPYAFYHVYTIPFYLLSIASCFSGLSVGRDAEAGVRRFVGLGTLCGYVAAICLLIYLPYQVGEMRRWAAPEEAPSYYSAQLAKDHIGYVSPSFFGLTGITLDQLRGTVK